MASSASVISLLLAPQGGMRGELAAHLLDGLRLHDVLDRRHVEMHALLVVEVSLDRLARVVALRSSRHRCKPAEPRVERRRNPDHSRTGCHTLLRNTRNACYTCNAPRKR